MFIIVCFRNLFYFAQNTYTGKLQDLLKSYKWKSQRLDGLVEIEENQIEERQEEEDDSSIEDIRTKKISAQLYYYRISVY